VWKFHGFSITQILREIIFGNSRGAKFAILAHSQALKFDFYEAPKTAKMAFFELLHSPKLISRKI